MHKQFMNTIDVLGIYFNNITFNETQDILCGYLKTNTNHIIVTPNPEAVMQAKRNPDFKNALLAADLSLADGTGIVWAAKRLSTPLPERVRGVDTIMALFTRLSQAEQKTTVYLLGGKPGVPELAADAIHRQFPHIHVIGFQHGYFKNEDEREVIKNINQLSPDILLICMGMPKAEIWASTNKHINTRISLCLGGTIDIFAGTATLAPAWIRKIGMEWLYRLIRQPSRFKRMLDIPRFMFAIIFRKK